MLSGNPYRASLSRHVLKTLPLLLVLFVSVSGMGQSRRLFTGKSIACPPLEVQQNVGSLPMNPVISPNGKYAIVSDMGFDQSLGSIHTQIGNTVSNVELIWKSVKGTNSEMPAPRYPVWSRDQDDE
jgi:hypothetical protein